jgi:hypothetical protein
MPSIQTMNASFAAGELSPFLYGRVDLSKYHIGCKTLRNFFVLPQGGVHNRAGTQFVATCRHVANQSRLVTFKFNQVQSYVLEFAHLIIRVIIDGGLVTNNDGSIFELPTPYISTDLFDLTFTQSADTMTITHRNYAPRDLTRTAHNAWTLTPITFAPGIGTPTGVTATPVGFDPSHGATGYWYKASAVAANGEEGLPSASANAVNNLTLSNANYNTVGWSAVTGAVSYIIYKGTGSGGSFGFIGTSTTLTFDDINISQDTSKSPQIFKNPLASENPGVVEYHQQRRVFASSWNFPQTVWATQSANIRSFDISDPTTDSDAITSTLSVKQVNEIRGLISLQSLLVFTSGAVFSFDGDQNGILTPAASVAKVRSYIGSSRRQPIIAGADIMFEQDRGSGIRTIRYNQQEGQYDPVDLSVMSSHLLVGFSVRDWTFAQEPHRIFWICRNDGALLGFTYMREQDVYAWHRHDSSANAAFISCAGNTENNEDFTYFVIRRTIGGIQQYYIERMASRVQGLWFLDCALRYTGVAATVISGLSHLEGQAVRIVSLSSGYPVALNSAIVTGGAVTASQPVTDAIVGLPYVSDIETLNMELGQQSIQDTKKKIVSATVRVYNSIGLKVGTDTSHLVLATKDSLDTALPQSPFTGDVRVLLDNSWETTGRAVVRQDASAPATILSIMPRVGT